MLLTTAFGRAEYKVTASQYKMKYRQAVGHNCVISVPWNVVSYVSMILLIHRLQSDAHTNIHTHKWHIDRNVLFLKLMLMVRTIQYNICRWYRESTLRTELHVLSQCFSYVTCFHNALVTSRVVIMLSLRICVIFCPTYSFVAGQVNGQT
jgi:hypothetical protein